MIGSVAMSDDGVRGMREKQKNGRQDKELRRYIVDRRLAAVSFVLGVLMGLIILLGIRYSRNELIYRTPGGFLGQLAGWTACVTVVVWAIYVGLDALGQRCWSSVWNRQRRTQARRGMNRESQESNRDVKSRGQESKIGTWLKWMLLSGHLFLRCVRAAPSVLWKTAADDASSLDPHAVSGTLHEDSGTSVSYVSGGDGAVRAVTITFYECGLFPVSVPDEGTAGTAMALCRFMGILDPESVSDGLFLCHDERCALWRIFHAGV